MKGVGVGLGGSGVGFMVWWEGDLGCVVSWGSWSVMAPALSARSACSLPVVGFSTLVTAHMSVWKGYVFTLCVCPQWGGGGGVPPIVPFFSTRCSV